MVSSHHPRTAATRLLNGLNIPFVPHSYSYKAQGGAAQASARLKVPLAVVVKTLVMTDDTGHHMLVLMHGNREVSTKKLARLLKVKRISPCDPNKARTVTGYQVGGISPLGTTQAVPIYAEASIFELASIFINGGKRGFLIEMAPNHLEAALTLRRVTVATKKSSGPNTVKTTHWK